jgi:trimethylamine--corrinoid protein Co-methyltransferase
MLATVLDPQSRRWTVTCPDESGAAEAQAAEAPAAQAKAPDPARSDGAGAYFSRLTDAQCVRLHEAALQVLERTGLLVEEPEALALLAAAGASVDGTRVRIPQHLVDQALSTVPREVTLFDRTGQPRLRLSGRATYFGTGSDCMYCFDHRTCTRRRAVLQDVKEAAHVTDACHNIDFVMSLFAPSDVTPEVMDRHQLATMMTTTSKPLVYITMNDELAHLDAIEMAAAVTGADSLSERPFIACYKNTLFPLVHNREAVRTLLDLSGRDLPCIYSPVSTAGTVAPMTVAGSVAVVHAGVLAGLVMSQLKRSGSPYIAIGWAGEAMDMRTMVDVFAWPDHRGVYSSVLHWLGLPMWTLGGVTDSKLPDQQASAEQALTLMADAVCGGHINHNIGFMESAFTGSLTQVVLGDDIAGWIKAFTAPVDISDESLGLDVIDEVGPGGLFLKHKHTRRHARERFQPHIFDRRTYEDWLRDGGKDATAVAAERVDELLASHQPEPLDARTRAAILAVVEKAEARVGRR